MAYIFRDTFTGAAGDLELHTPDVGKAYYWPTSVDTMYNYPEQGEMQLDGSGYLKCVTGTNPSYFTLSRCSYRPFDIYISGKIIGTPSAWSAGLPHVIIMQNGRDTTGNSKKIGIDIVHNSFGSTSIDFDFYFLDPNTPIHTESVVISPDGTFTAQLSIGETSVTCYVNGNSVHTEADASSMYEYYNTSLSGSFNTDTKGFLLDEVAIISTDEIAALPSWTPTPKGKLPCPGYVRAAVFGLSNCGYASDDTTPPRIKDDFGGDIFQLFRFWSYLSSDYTNVVHVSENQMEDPNFFSDNEFTLFIYARQYADFGEFPSISATAAANIKNYFTGNFCLFTTDIEDGTEIQDDFAAELTNRAAWWCNNKGFLGFFSGAKAACGTTATDSTFWGDFTCGEGALEAITPVGILSGASCSTLYAVTGTATENYTFYKTAAGEEHWITSGDAIPAFSYSAPYFNNANAAEFIHYIENIGTAQVLMTGPSSYEELDVFGRTIPGNIPYVIANEFTGYSTCPYFEAIIDGTSGVALYYMNKDPENVAISATYITDINDKDLISWKHLKAIEVIGDYGDNSVALSWDKTGAYSEWNTLGVKYPNLLGQDQAVRWLNLGHARRPAFKLEFTGNSNIVHDAIEVIYNLKTH